MAEGIAKESGSNISIATTGIAGPGGGTKEKPVGLVYIGVSVKDETVVEKFKFSGERDKIRDKSYYECFKYVKTRSYEKRI